MTSLLVPAAVLTPLLGCVLAVLLPQRDRVVGLIGTLATAAVNLVLVAEVARHGVQRHLFGGWALPLGLQVRADGLAAVFVGLVAVVGTAVAVYAWADPRTRGQDAGYWPLWLLLLAGLDAAFVAGDLFNAYVALEVVGLAAVGLVALGGRKAWRAAFDYLVVAVSGSLLLLVAVAVCYAATGTLDLALAGERLPAADGSARLVVLVVGLTGLAFKAALVPMHGWLPPAHGSSPAAVSPVLSALVVKAAFVIALRLWFEVAGPDRRLAAVLAVLAVAAVLWGGLQALQQDGFKRVVAYSTVAQMGYLFLVFPLTTFVADAALARTAWTGAILMAVAHALAKAALFMSAGTLLVSFGTDRLVDIAGSARTMPLVGMTTAIAAVSLAGLPISAGFVAKWQLAAAGVAAAQVWLVVLLIAGAVLAGGYLLRPVAAMLRDSDVTQELGRATPADPRRVPQLAALVLALLAVLLGLRASDLAELSLVGLTLGVAP